MQITIEIQDAFAERIIAMGKQPSQYALEALALAGYRTKRLSEYQVQQMLSFATRFHVHAFLKDHDTCLNYSVTDLDDDMENLRASKPSRKRGRVDSTVGFRPFCRSPRKHCVGRDILYRA